MRSPPEKWITANLPFWKRISPPKILARDSINFVAACLNAACKLQNWPEYLYLLLCLAALFLRTYHPRKWKGKSSSSPCCRSISKFLSAHRRHHSMAQSHPIESSLITLFTVWSAGSSFFGGGCLVPWCTRLHQRYAKLLRKREEKHDPVLRIKFPGRSFAFSVVRKVILTQEVIFAISLNLFVPFSFFARSICETGQWHSFDPVHDTETALSMIDEQSGVLRKRNVPDRRK